MPKIVELRQERSLMRSNFDGYKLSLDSVPIHRRDLPAAVYKAETNDEQYSLLHAQLFSMQNLLHSDPWHKTSAYHINRLGEIVRSGYVESTGRPEALQVVYRLTNEMLGVRTKGDYNYSLKFISEKFAVLCNGKQNILLLDTGDRLKAQEWKLIVGHQLVDACSNFWLYDCRLDVLQEQKQISLLLGSVLRHDMEQGSSYHYMQLQWAKWILKDKWEFSILDCLEGKGSIYYCAFEPRAESLILCSNREYEFVSEKLKKALDQAENAVNETEEKVKPQLHDGCNENGMEYAYEWTQTDEDIVIKFNMQDVEDKSSYKVISTAENLNVKCKDLCLINESLFAKVDADLTTWTMVSLFSIIKNLLII